MKKLLPLLLAAALASGCSTMSELSDSGQGDKIVFADPATAWLPQGTFPSISSLRGVGPGITKPQLYEMFGRPHFREGFVNVREWDYLFHFKTPGGVVDCQYKVVFDPEYKVSATYWKEPSCADLLLEKPPEVKIVEKIVERVVEKEVPVMVQPEPRRTRLAADTLFPFDKSALRDLRPGGIERLDQLVGEIRSAGDFDRITIVGHTDEIGTEKYNLALSAARAATIRDYLVSQGIPGDRIEASGVGEAVPVVTSCPKSPWKQRVACLEPNRRVEIETWAKTEVLGTPPAAQ